MFKPTISPINEIHEHLQIKYENIDSLDLIDSTRCTEAECCQQSKFQIECPKSCRLSNIINLKHYYKYKLEDIRLQSVFGFKAHFKIPCFNCSSSFNGSRFEDGIFNLQKMSEIGTKCGNCQKNYTKERLFHHNCNICNTSFKNCKLLFNHRSRKHDSEKPHQCPACHLSLSKGNVIPHMYKHTLPHICPLCNKRYAMEKAFKSHILSHTGVKSFSCKYCPKQYKTKQYLDIHLFEHFGGETFQCNTCDKTFPRRHMLNRHTRIHMENLLQCPNCPKQYRSKIGLDVHLFEHNGGKKFKCDVCDKSFAKAYILNQHKFCHNIEKQIQCEYCPKQYNTKHKLDVHLFKHTGGKNKNFKCDVCSKTFAKAYILKQHKLIHIQEPLQCPNCPKQYKTKNGLDVHLFEHTGGKKFNCDLCDKSFAMQYMLTQHKSFHMGELRCKFCPKEFKTKRNLDIHTFEHTGGKQFKCDLCYKSFAKQYKLNQHKLTHMEEKFQCEYCPKQYKAKYNLDIHLFEHTGDKKYQCDSCDKTFGKLFLLSKHKEMHIMEKSFQCQICLKFIKRKRDFRRHMKRTHNISLELDDKIE